MCNATDFTGDTAHLIADDPVARNEETLKDSEAPKDGIKLAQRCILPSLFVLLIAIGMSMLASSSLVQQRENCELVPPTRGANLDVEATKETENATSLRMSVLASSSLAQQQGACEPSATTLSPSWDVETMPENESSPRPLKPPDVSKLTSIQKIFTVDLLEDKPRPVINALKEVARLCNVLEDSRDNQQNRQAINDAGGASTIVGVMRKWYNDTRIQVEGCKSLHGISFNSYYAYSKTFHEQLRASGGFDVIVWTMTHYSRNAAIQQHGIGALGNLVVDDKTAKEFITQEAHKPIIDAMDKFPDNGEVQRNGSIALWKLLEKLYEGNYVSREFLDRLRAAGALHVLVNALEMHQKDGKPHGRDIQKYAGGAIKKLLS